MAGEAAGGTAGGGAAGAGAPAATGGTTNLDRLIAKHGGDPRRALASLAEENGRRKRQIDAARSAGTITVQSAELEAENRDLVRQLDDLAGRLPPAGALILTGDDVAAWNAFRELKLKPDDVKAAITERDTLKTRDVQRSRSDSIRDAAEANSYKPKVLETLLGGRPVDFEQRDVQVAVTGPDGDKVETKKVWHVKGRDANATPEPLDKYVERELADFKGALAAEKNGGGTGGAGGSSGTAGAAAGATRYPAQGSAANAGNKGGPQGPSTVVQSTLNAKYNPASLLPQGQQGGGTQGAGAR